MTTTKHLNRAVIFAATALLFFTTPDRARSDDSMRVIPNGDVGIGTDAPTAPLHVKRADGSARVLVEETSAAVVPREMFKMTTAGGSYFTLENTNTSDSWFFVHENSAPNRFIITSSASAGPKFVLTNSGSITIPGTITTMGSCGGGCDRVFSAEYQLPSIEEHAEAMWRDSYLPAVGPTKEGAPLDLSTKTTGILNELEKAHIYIDQLNNDIRNKDQEIAELRQQDAEFAKRLARMEALLDRSVGVE